MASQITSVSIVYSTICSGADPRKYQRSGSLAFVKGIHWWSVDSPHKGPVTPVSIWWRHHDVLNTHTAPSGWRRRHSWTTMSKYGIFSISFTPTSESCITQYSCMSLCSFRWWLSEILDINIHIHWNSRVAMMQMIAWTCSGVGRIHQIIAFTCSGMTDSFNISWITMTSLWVRWRLKLPASRLFGQSFTQAQIKECIKVPCHWPLWGESTDDQWIPLTKGQ